MVETGVGGGPGCGVVNKNAFVEKDTHGSKHFEGTSNFYFKHFWHTIYIVFIELAYR